MSKCLRNPGRTFAAAVFTCAIGAIFLNALFLQSARHPAPLFAKSVARGIAPAQMAKTPEPKQTARPAPPQPNVPDMREAGKFSQPRLRQVALPKIDEIDSIQAKPVNLPREEERNVSPGPARDLIGSLIRGEPAPRPPGRIPDKTPALSKPRIEAAQRALVKLGHRLDVDGLTGPATLAAVEAFQSAHRLPATGTLDARTINALATKSRIRIP